MRETTVSVRNERMVKASPDQIWAVLSSPGAWSLRLESFAFDAPSADGTRRFRVLARALHPGVTSGQVFEIADETPSQTLTLQYAGPFPRGVRSYSISLAPKRRGTKVTLITEARENVSKVNTVGRGLYRTLEPWLDECAHVAEGRKPSPGEGMPAAAQAACMARQHMKAVPVSASGSVLISAPPEQVWRTVWDPATSVLMNPDNVAAGCVPGTPCQEAGEIQYTIHHLPNGGLHPHFLAVDECVVGRSALAHWAFSPLHHGEVNHEVEPDDSGARLTLTHRDFSPRANGQRERLEKDLEDQLSRYKSFIEEQAGR